MHVSKVPKPWVAMNFRILGPILVPTTLLVLIAWIVVAVQDINSERVEPMERTSRIQQLYGYTVCLVAVVVFLMSIAALIDGLYDLTNPLQSSRFGGPASLTSFEAYKATRDADKPRMMSGVDGPTKAGRDSTPEMSDAELRAEYVALRADRIEKARFEGAKTLTRSILLLLISGALFFIHWRWLARKEPTTD